MDGDFREGAVPVTDPRVSGDKEEMLAAARRPSPGSVPPGVPALAPNLARVYEDHFDFVWRSARRLGVPAGAVDDVVQDVFLVVHRQIAGFEGRSSVKTWLFGILRNLVLQQRRAWARRGREEVLEETRVEGEQASPRDELEEIQARRALQAMLDELGEERRAVFVLAELEQMSAPEIAEAMGIKLNTVYSRLRLARAEMEKALVRHRARERGREP